MTGNRPHMIRVPDDLWDRARAKAAHDGESIAAVIRRFLRTYTGEGVVDGVTEVPYHMAR